MRVIAGIAKNKRLKAPPGINTRPITDMIKEALFNVLGTKVNDSVFLDLFAGSGSVGIEALSRGAKHVIFVDNNYDAVKTIKDNLQQCGFKEKIEVYKNDVFKALDILIKRNIKFDFIYIDPPFTIPEISEKVLDDLDSKAGLLASNGTIIIRTQRKVNLPDNYNNLVKFKLSGYGESTLHYYSLS